MRYLKSENGHMLESLGLSDAEEMIYEGLLSGSASPTQLATYTRLPPGRVRAALASLESKGLISRTPGKGGRYLPASPEIALETLLLRRDEELKRARIEVASFVERFKKRASRSPGELVEVLAGGEAIAVRFAELQAVAEGEVLIIDSPPYATSNLENEFEFAALNDGISYRAIYAAEAIAIPGRLENLDALASAGEQARLLDEVPMKLAIADSRLALLPLSLKEGVTEEALLVHASSLLESLRLLFESLWERAIPLPAAAIERAEGLESSDRRLLALLAAGHKEETIARQLKVHPRTVERRLGRLMDQVGVRTRFQLGLYAVARGWITPPQKER